MKKIISVFTALLLVMALAACGTESGSKDNSNALSFKSGSAELVMNADASSALQALGEAKNTFREESCAGLGYEITYKYPGFELVTYQKEEGQPEYIFRVLLKDDTVSTAEGVCLGDTAEKVVTTYGTGSADDAEIEVVRGNCSLDFVMDGGKVASIEYMANDAVGG